MRKWRRLFALVPGFGLFCGEVVALASIPRVTRTAAGHLTPLQREIAGL